MGDHKDLWESVGTSEAYYAVATFDRYRAGNLDAGLREEFFESGRSHIDEMWPVFEELHGGDFRPARAVDYGCGVGRVLIPLAGRSETAVGIDISETMLAECRRNLETAGADNFELIEASEFLDSEPSEFDLVHSYIVIQHVNPEIGYGIVRRLVNALNPGGIGMIHVTLRSGSQGAQRLREKFYRSFPSVYGAINKVLGRDRVVLPMYEYDRNKVLEIIRANGCEVAREIGTDHGYQGAMFFFKKSA